MKSPFSRYARLSFYFFTSSSKVKIHGRTVYNARDSFMSFIFGE
jgi:hypothetical protein